MTSAEYAIRLVYGGYWMRSLAEVRIAALLDVWRIPWHYEQKCFRTPHGNYVPDFCRAEQHGCRAPDWFPDFLEVKPEDVVIAAARALGLPDWDGGTRSDRIWKPTGSDGRFDVYGISRHSTEVCPTDPAWEPLAKPLYLAGAGRKNVWVVGKPGCNSIVIRLDHRGGVTADRDCQLFRHPSNYDGAGLILQAIRETDEARRARWGSQWDLEHLRRPS